MGISFQQVVDGHGEALAALARLAACAPESLSAHALRRQGAVYVLRGQIIDKDEMRRARLHVCPACLLADVLGSPLEPSKHAYVRAEWLINSIRTCAEHSTALRSLDDLEGLTALMVHDFSARLAPFLNEFGRSVAPARRREASGLERYLSTRIEGAGPAGSAWLDSLEFHVAAKTCEMVGAVKMYGRTPSLRRLDEDDWWAAGAAGFAIAAEGPSGLRSFLSELQDTYDYTGPEGPQAVFGRLYQWLSFSAKDAAFDAVRGLMAEHIIATMPLAAGEVVLGRTVERRILHSIRSASLETGRHPKRLRRLLGEAGLIPPGAAAREAGNTNAWVVFRADLAAPFLSSAVEQMGLAEAGAYLNAPRVQIRLIADSGLIKPFVELKRGRRRAFARSELDRFLRELTRDAGVSAQAGGNIQSIPEAAHRSNCSAVEIIRFVLDRRLEWVGARQGVSGYLSVLVDVDEIRRLTRGAETEGLPMSGLPKELGVSWLVARAFLRLGLFTTRSAKNPVNRCPMKIIPRQDVDRFHREFVTLFQIGRESGRHFRRLKAELDQLGVEPCFPKEQVPCTIYRRADVAGRVLPHRSEALAADRLPGAALRLRPDFGL